MSSCGAEYKAIWALDKIAITLFTALLSDCVGQELYLSIFATGAVAARAHVRRWQAHDPNFLTPDYKDVLTLGAKDYNKDVLAKLLQKAPQEHKDGAEPFTLVRLACDDSGICLLTRPRSAAESAAPAYKCARATCCMPSLCAGASDQCGCQALLRVPMRHSCTVPSSGCKVCAPSSRAQRQGSNEACAGAMAATLPSRPRRT